jgi:hypothetical protein
MGYGGGGGGRRGCRVDWVGHAGWLMLGFAGGFKSGTANCGGVEMECGGGLAGRGENASERRGFAW